MMQDVHWRQLKKHAWKKKLPVQNWEINGAEVSEVFIYLILEDLDVSSELELVVFVFLFSLSPARPSYFVS